jgi:hypothetical protein
MGIKLRLIQDCNELIINLINISPLIFSYAIGRYADCNFARFKFTHKLKITLLRHIMRRSMMVIPAMPNTLLGRPFANSLMKTKMEFGLT